MKKSYTLIAVICVVSICTRAQYNTINPDNKTLKKGLYKNYQEFIGNTPSLTDDFVTVPLYLNGSDTANPIAAVYLYSDTLKEAGPVWGFCNGKSVYINLSPSLPRSCYWKLISLGNYPFFKGCYTARGFIKPGPVSLDGYSKSQAIIYKPRNLVMQIVDNKGKFREPGIADMKKLLGVKPELLAAFKKEAGRYEQFDNPNADVFEFETDYADKLAVISKYLVLLNAP